jgi:hypothetical protein
MYFVACYISDCASMKINIMMWYLNWVVMLNVRCVSTDSCAQYFICYGTFTSCQRNVIYKPNTTQALLVRRVTIHNHRSSSMFTTLDQHGGKHDNDKHIVLDSKYRFNHLPTSAVEMFESRIRASEGTSVFKHTMYAKSGCYEESLQNSALCLSEGP